MTSIGKILSKENICDFWNDLSVGQKEEIEKVENDILRTIIEILDSNN